MQDSQDVYSPPKAKLKLDNEVNPKAIKYFKGWLMFYIVLSVIGGIVGGIVGGVLGGIGENLEKIQTYSGIASFIVSIPISFFTFRWTVNKYIISQYIAPVENDKTQAYDTESPS